MSDHPSSPKSNSKIVPPFIPKPKESLEAENARLKAENERLRKAGDFMQKSMLECGPNEMADAFHHDDWWASYNGWIIAKSFQS